MTPPITPACSDTARQQLFSAGLSCDRKKEHILCSGEEEEEVLFPHSSLGRGAEEHQDNSFLPKDGFPDQPG